MVEDIGRQPAGTGWVLMSQSQGREGDREPSVFGWLVDR